MEMIINHEFDELRTLSIDKWRSVELLAHRVLLQNAVFDILSLKLPAFDGYQELVRFCRQFKKIDTDPSLMIMINCLYIAINGKGSSGRRINPPSARW
ncbi:hypothetical protein AVEN_54568-1 [Araneus ventricosus]|uniref:Uncharacterized protein n=1 Tax=Araneus ventricosus TaxID=182803 RepID=A0A4Y2BL16_ARAVE|nr:hypothetical protein AVEN_54568-1 [Araneus ventricosus]